MTKLSSAAVLAAILPLSLSTPASAQSAKLPARSTPVVDLLEQLGPEVQQYNEHIVFLSSPFMEGRVPGSNGMEVAKDYSIYWFKRAGCVPGFKDKQGEPTWRQPFPLGSRTVVKEQVLTVNGHDFVAGTDFVVTGLGSGGELEGEVAFAGYSIAKGKEGYSSYREDDSLTDKIAIVLRFEPMDAEGKSLWAEKGWSPATRLAGKMRGAARRGAKAILFVNTPGAKDPRVDELYEPAGGGRRLASIPVLQMTPSAASKLVEKLGSKKSLLELRKQADEAGGVVDLPGKIKINAGLERVPTIAENVGAMIPGKGALKDEIIVVGAHLDHLGMGNFGSREGPGKLHPGADDNATGVAAILMMAKTLKRRYDRLPDGESARTMLFIAFSGEESGLVGSRYYVRYPIAPIKKHAFMINFDMIGRLKNGRLAVYGGNSGKGLSKFLEQFIAECPLEIVQNPRGFGGSDHLPFVGKRIPYMFSICADFHSDYHTSRDVSEKIGRVDAVHTTRFYTEVAWGLTTRTERFEWQKRQPRRTPGRRRRGGR